MNEGESSPSATLTPLLCSGSILDAENELARLVQAADGFHVQVRGAAG